MLVVLLWAVVFLPFAGFQSLRYEEGTRALLARDILMRQSWLDPALLGEAYLKKPPLLPWLIAASGWLLGGIDEWAVRLPPLLATLAIGLGVYWLLRYEVGRLCALFGAAAAMLSPMVMLKASVAETDTTASALCFFAFVVYWRATRSGTPSAASWLLCGLMMGLAALAKGPPPLIFPLFGLLAIGILRDGLKTLTGWTLSLVTATALLAIWALPHYGSGSLATWRQELRIDWTIHSMSATPDALTVRLRFLATAIVENMPTTLLALPALIGPLRRRLGIAPDLAQALTIYVGLGVLLFCLAGASAGRYAMPATPALGAAAGLVFQRLRKLQSSQAWLAAGALAAAACFQLTANLVVQPLRGDVMQRNRQAAAQIDSRIALAPGPLYIDGDYIDLNVVFYLHGAWMALYSTGAPAAAHGWLLVGGGGNAPRYLQAATLSSQPELDIRSRDDERLRLYRF